MKLFTADTAPVDDRPLGDRKVLARRCLRKAAVVAIALLTGACQAGLSDPPDAEQPPSLAARPRAAVDPLPPANLQSAEAQGPRRTAAPVMVRGTDVSATAPAGSPTNVTPNGAADISFNFVGADVRDVMRELVGDQLRLAYAVDPKIQAKITAQTGKPIPRSAVLPVLESMLRASGVALVEAGGVYRAVPLEEASKEGSAALAHPGATEPGYSIRALPLKFIKAAELKSILNAFVPPGGVLEADDAHNVVIVSGSSGDLDGFVELVRQFDVDWLAGKTFLIYPLRVGRAKEIVNELQAILDQGAKDTKDAKDAGPLAGLVRVVPIERLNAILVISSQASYINRVRSWIDRLDFGDDSATPRFFQYQVRNTRAVDLARVLAQMFSSNDVRIVRPEKAPAPNFTEMSANPPGAGGVVATMIPGTLNPTFTPAARPSGKPPEEAEAPPGAPGAAANELQLPQARIVADEKNNAIVVYARPQDYRSIRNMLQQLDIAPQQVLIEATIAELTLNDALQYGLQYFLKTGSNQFELTTTTAGNLTPSTTGTPTPATPAGLTAADIAGVFPGFNYVVATATQHVILSLLKSVSRVRVLSSPQLLVRDNQTAGLQVGAQVPIVIQSAESVAAAGAPIVNSIQYRNTGVILQVTPRINANGMISLDIDQEVSDVAPTTSSTINSPTIDDRHLVSSVIVHDGETIALGGLITENSSDMKGGIPVLSEIPLVGPLFRTTNRSQARTELIVLLSPRVVRDVDDARAMTADLRSQIRALRPLDAKSR